MIYKREGTYEFHHINGCHHENWKDNVAEVLHEDHVAFECYVGWCKDEEPDYLKWFNEKLKQVLCLPYNIGHYKVRLVEGVPYVHLQADVGGLWFVNNTAIVPEGLMLYLKENEHKDLYIPIVGPYTQTDTIIGRIFYDEENGWFILYKSDYTKRL